MLRPTCLLALCLMVVPVHADIAVFPDSVTLIGSQGGQELVVQRTAGGLVLGQVTEGAEFVSSDSGVVRWEAGRLLPAGNGKATVTIRSGTDSASVAVEVRDFEQPQAWSFRNHVQSVLTKAGCNMGACHGATAGKGGFRLSLRGYDPETDFLTITRQARGRRVAPDDPGRSLLLTKPTGAIPHQGGLRFTEDSPEYRTIAEWIAQGQVGPAADDPRIERIEILPPAVRLTPGTKQSFLVRAHFSDSRAEDVTRWAKYSSTNFTVATVDERGQIEVNGSGEGAITAWYLAQNVTATVTVPYEHATEPQQFAESPRANLIDELVLAKLQSLNMPPSPRSTDGEFLRRASLDTLGVLPTPEESKAFLADEDPLKRQKLIDQLLTRPEFVDYWTYQWSDLLLVTGSRLRPAAVKAYSGWIRERVANNLPWDQFVREILIAQGSTLENGAANFYALHQDPQDMSETVSMAFLGMSIQCARCHDHPLEKWTNDDYYGMVSLFARVRGKGWGGDFRGGDGNRLIFAADRGEVMQPRTGRPQPPRPLDAAAVAFEDPHDRREALANWVCSPNNPYFTRAIVNRVWANYLGTGLVEQVDDLRLTNPPSNPLLLDALSAELVRQNYDLKSLMRLILNSETYQRSSQVLPENAMDERFYARCTPRRLKAEVLLDAISAVAESPTAFKDYPAGTRALQLPDADVASYFLEAFGRPERILTCTCERADEPSMTQVLHLANGKTVLEKLEAKDGRISRWIAENTADQQILDELYLAALSRLPRPEVSEQVLKLLGETPAEERRQALEDLAWSVLTSREFLFQH